VFSARSLALTPGTLGLKRLRSKRGKGGLRPAEKAGELVHSHYRSAPSYRRDLSRKKHTSGTQKAKLKGV